MRAPVLGLATAIVVAACPAVASATDYCVPPNDNCAGTPVPSFDKALELAAQGTNADRIFLGDTTYVAQTGTGFTYNVQGSPLEIIGKGSGKTALTSPPGASAVLNLDGGQASVRDLTIRIPQNAAAGASGLSTWESARGIDVVEDQTQTNTHRGVVLSQGASLEDSTVTLGGSQNTTAVVFGLGGGNVLRSALTAWEGVASNYGGLIDRSRVTGVERGVYGMRDGTTITATLVRFSKSGGAGIGALAGAGAPTSVKADGVTIIGPGLANTFGVGATAGGLTPFENAELILTNSIVRGVSSSIVAVGAGRGADDANVRTSYSDYDPGGNTTFGSNGTITESNVSYVGDAGFVDPAVGDYHLRSSSPLLDRGDTVPSPGLDLDGNALITDGDGDGVARRDMGAFEHAAVVPVRAPAVDSTRPLITAFRADPSAFAVPKGTRLRYQLSEAARVTITIQRNVPGRRSGGRCVRPSRRLQHAKRCVRHRTVGTLKNAGVHGANKRRFTGRIAKRALRPGSYRAVVRATDAAGNRSAPKSVRLRVRRKAS